MPYCNKYFQFLIIYVWSIFFGFSQESIEFEKLSIETGVPQSNTYAIDQDSLGNLWIASEEGVVRYNSKKSFYYNKYQGLPPNVGNRVSTIMVDSNNKVWAGLESGVYLYNSKNDTFNYVGSNPNTGPKGINCVYENKAGTIWVGANNGLWILRKNQNIRNFEKIANVTVETILEDSFGLWLGANKGLYLMTPPTNEIKKIRFTPTTVSVVSLLSLKGSILVGTETNGLYSVDLKGKVVKIELTSAFNNVPIRDIVLGNGETVLVGTDGNGIFRLDASLKVTQHFFHDDNNPYTISSNEIYDIENGNEGIVWVATHAGGLNFIDPKKNAFTKLNHLANNTNSMVNDFAQAIELDERNRIWFGTKKGISIWDRDDNSWTTVKGLNEIIMTIESDSHYMWVGTYNKGIYKINIDQLVPKRLTGNFENFVDLDKIFALTKDSNGNLWVGDLEENLIRINSEGIIKNYPIANVKCVLELKSGNLLVGGRDGVHLINSNSDKIEQLAELGPNRSNLNYLKVNAFTETEDGHYIISTNGAGLLIYDPDSHDLQILNRNSGLPSDIVQGAVLFTDNSLWVSTAKGLTNIRMSPQDTTITVFDESDGLASTEFNFGSFAILDEETLAFGGINGVSLVRPNDIDKSKTAPKIAFESFSLFNKKIAPGEKPLKSHINANDSLVLKYNQNAITLDFVGILHNASSKVLYSWRLDGLESEWSTPSSQSSVNYTNLKPGTYNFNLKASNRDGLWGPVKNLIISISPPWWSTDFAKWLYILAVILLLTTIVYFTRFIVNKKRAEEQISLFNTITHEIRTPLTILLSSLENEVKTNTKVTGTGKIKSTVKQINSLFEQMLNFQKVVSVDLISSNILKIDLKNYIEDIIGDFEPLLKEKELTITIHNNLSEKFFFYEKEDLNKILFNLLTNAIKYSKRKGKIEIYLNSNKKFLVIKVIDNGIGIPKNQQKNILKKYYRARNAINSQVPGIGLGLMIVKNLVKRKEGTIDFKSEEGKGTVFVVKLLNQERLYNKHDVDGRTLPDNPVSIDHSLMTQEYSDRKILIVEDNDELRRILFDILGIYFHVYEARNGKEGIEIAGKVFPDIIVTDLIMPEMDGMEMTKALQKDIGLNHIPIFMMTVLQGNTQKLESISSGVAEYIEKPINFDLLIARMVNVLEWNKRIREKYVHESEMDKANMYRTKKDEEFVQNLEDYIIDNLHSPEFSINNLCTKVGMSRTSLYMKLKSMLDLSPQDFIINTKLRHAKKQLLKGDANIKEVAYNSGFSNPNYFSTSFKKFFGETPSSYLQRLGNDQQ